MNNKKIALIILFFLIIITPIVNANPVYYNDNTGEIAITFIILGLLFLLSCPTEILIIKMFLRRNKLKQNSALFYKSLIGVNLVTFIFTQLIALFIAATPQSNILIFLAVCLLIEIFPIGTEFFLFSLIYNQLSELSSFEYPIRPKTTFLSTITANLVTFLMGIVIQISILPQMI
jgi:hypothetical protein